MSENTALQASPGALQETQVYPDYFGFQRNERWYFPDGEQFIEFKVMNEGMKAKFQKTTSRDLTLDRNSGNARIKVDPGTDRHELIRASVVNWNMYRNGQPYPYSDRALMDFLNLADPRLIEELEKAIRKANPWLLGDMTVEDIDKEIENLREMREVALEREQGEDSSVNR